jgi:hypothetical protein
MRRPVPTLLAGFVFVVGACRNVASSGSASATGPAGDAGAGADVVAEAADAGGLASPDPGTPIADPRLLATLEDDPLQSFRGMAVDETTLYLLTSARLYAIPKTGGAARVLAEPEATADDGGAQTRDKAALAIDATHVYFTVASSNMQATDGFVVRMPKGGGPSESVFVGRPYWITRDGDQLYVLDQGPCTGDPCTAGVTIRRVPVTGGPSAVVADGLRDAGPVVLDASYLYFSTPSWFDQTTSTSHGATIRRLPRAGGSPESLASELGDFLPILVRVEDRLGYTNSDTGELVWLATSGGTPAPTGRGAFHQIVSDGSSLYASCAGAAPDTEAVLALDPHTGEARAVLARWTSVTYYVGRGNSEVHHDFLRGLTFDATQVYMARTDDGGAIRVYVASHD